MKSALIALMALFLSLNAYAQSNYRPGYIITIKGDTVAGFINYKGNKSSAKSCEYKKGLSGDVITYKPFDLKGYGFVNDKFFQSIEIRSTDNNGVSKDQLFVEVLVRGVVSLYRDPSAFYIAKGDSTLHKLVVREDLEVIDGKKMLRRSTHHIGILTYMMHDCGRLKEKIERIFIEEKDLTKLVEEYNRCISTDYISYKESKPWFRAGFGVTAGYRMSKLTFHSQERAMDLFTKGTYRSQDLEAGVLLSFLSPRITERLAFQSGVLFCSPQYSAYLEAKEGNRVYRNDVIFTLNEFKIPLGLQYRFPEKQYTPFFNIGLSSTLHLKAHFLQILEVEGADEVHRYEYRNFPIAKNQLGIWGGFGVERTVSGKLKGYVEFSYERTSGLSYNIWDVIRPVSSNIANLHFTVGIKY
ncbi:outer membrane beta-barrel protein [Cesiribacter sp. SM1]|uniref:outer membrane beta-barrel protein n=1 Tax=Cesiribacter sp. SM1 TaxID=2861196 RepID=UPI001CD70C05|nr:outer membrane beta-barrel protein [Cesiribacter sp. SM1]